MKSLDIMINVSKQAWLKTDIRITEPPVEKH
jgi:hypothetical protein